jgi:hypothetical protein
MLPSSLDVPAAAALVAAGTMACFFGYRLFRLVLAIFGFLLGAVAAGVAFDGAGSTTVLVAVAVGGLLGAALLTAVYFVGVALVGAALGAAVAHLAFMAGGGDPTVLTVVLCSIAGAVLSVYLQRYVLIVGTAFGGAWSIIVGALAFAGNSAAVGAARAGQLWVIFPLDPEPNRGWVPVVWAAVGIAGLVVQLGWTGGEGGRVGRRRKTSK